MATTSADARLEQGQIGLLGVLMPGLAQVAPAFNLFFTAGAMAGLAGASIPLVFLISVVGMGATASTLAQFSGVYPSAGSFLTYISRSLGARVALTVGVITLLGYIIAFAGIYVFVGDYIVQNVLNGGTNKGLTALVTLVYGVLVVAPVVVGLKFGVRTTVALYLFEVVLLGVLIIGILAHGGASGLSLTPFRWPHGTGASDTFVAFSLAVLAFGGFEASAPLAEETRNPKRNVPVALLLTVAVSGLLYVLGSYALVIAFGPEHADKLAADANPFQTAAKTYVSALAPLITYVFLSSVTSSYIAANTQSSRVIYAGARGGLWSRTLAEVSPRFRTPARAAVAFVLPSVLIGEVSLLVSTPGTAAGFLGTYGILGVILMYVMANVALVAEWSSFRRRGIPKNVALWVVTPVVGIAVLAIPIWGDLRPGQPAPYKYLPWLTIALIAVGVLYTVALNARRPDVLRNAPALLEGDESLTTHVAGEIPAPRGPEPERSATEPAG